MPGFHPSSNLRHPALPDPLGGAKLPNCSPLRRLSQTVRRPVVLLSAALLAYSRPLRLSQHGEPGIVNAAFHSVLNCRKCFDSLDFVTLLPSFHC